MIEPIADMPPGTLGFRAVGKLSHSDYVDVAIPPLRDAVDRGEKIRLLYQIGPGFEGIETGAIWDELKADFGLGLGHLSAWERMAIVSDEGWLSHLMAVFGWMVPGELKLFGLDEMDAAKAWLAR
jgi:SpoIIAA-like